MFQRWFSDFWVVSLWASQRREDRGGAERKESAEEDRQAKDKERLAAAVATSHDF